MSSTSPPDASSVWQDTGSLVQSSPEFSAGGSAISKRRKKFDYPASPGFTRRADRLGMDEKRILRDYAGDTTETRTFALRMMESYRRENNNKPPIMGLDSKPKSWKCMICPESEQFLIFQRIALHLTSTHWRLLSWPCRFGSCTRSYTALDQLRRHVKKDHPNLSTPFETATSPDLTPPSQPHTVDADFGSQEQPIPVAAASRPHHTGYAANLPCHECFHFHPCPYRTIIQPQTMYAVVQSHSQGRNEPLDANPQALEASRPDYEGYGVDLASREQSPPHPPFHYIPSQTQVALPPEQAPPNYFVHNNAPNSYHTTVPSTSMSMNIFPSTVNNAGEQVRFTGYTQYGQTNASGFPTNEDLFQSSTYEDDLATSWHDKVTSRQADTNFLVNRSGVDAPWCPTISQLELGCSSTSNSFGRPTSSSVPLMYSRSFSAEEDEMRRHMSRALPPSGRLYRHEVVDQSENGPEYP